MTFYRLKHRLNFQNKHTLSPARWPAGCQLEFSFSVLLWKL